MSQARLSQCVIYSSGAKSVSEHTMFGMVSQSNVPDHALPVYRVADSLLNPDPKLSR